MGPYSSKTYQAKLAKSNIENPSLTQTAPKVAAPPKIAAPTTPIAAPIAAPTPPVSKVSASASASASAPKLGASMTPTLLKYNESLLHTLIFQVSLGKTPLGIIKVSSVKVNGFDNFETIFYLLPGNLYGWAVRNGHTLQYNEADSTWINNDSGHLSIKLQSIDTTAKPESTQEPAQLVVKRKPIKANVGDKLTPEFLKANRRFWDMFTFKIDQNIKLPSFKVYAVMAADKGGEFNVLVTYGAGNEESRYNSHMENESLEYDDAKKVWKSRKLHSEFLKFDSEGYTFSVKTIGRKKELLGGGAQKSRHKRRLHTTRKNNE